MSDAALTLEAAEKAAAAKGLVLKFPADNELFVDIDTDTDFAVFQKQLATLMLHVPVLGFDTTSSNSGGAHRHVVVRLGRNVVDDVERVLLQAVLGSDRLRELLSFVRIRSGVRVSPTVFFERPPAPLPEVAAPLARGGASNSMYGDF